MVELISQATRAMMSATGTTITCSWADPVAVDTLMRFVVEMPAMPSGSAATYWEPM